MYISGQCGLGSVCLAGLVSGCVFANEGHWVFRDRFGDRGRKKEDENRYRRGSGIEHPSVSRHFLWPSCSLCMCKILYATGSFPTGGSVLLVVFLDCKFKLFGLYMKM